MLLHVLDSLACDKEGLPMIQVWLWGVLYLFLGIVAAIVSWLILPEPLSDEQRLNILLRGIFWPLALLGLWGFAVIWCWRLWSRVVDQKDDKP
jgi:hypothetical protein